MRAMIRPPCTTPNFTVVPPKSIPIAVGFIVAFCLTIQSPDDP